MLKTKEKEVRELRNGLELIKKMKAIYDDNNKKEKEIMIKHCKVHLVKNVIEKRILKRFKVFVTRCHGGDL